MGSSYFLIILLLNFLQLLYPSVSLPLCTDSRAPLPQKTPLTFCPYNGTSCCSSSDNKQLKNQFDAMNISDSGCASLVKSILCAIKTPHEREKM
ncbi:hipl1 protein [Nicotiana attenuata]|uniref:Hipl1 protein n=1 Tax=Nicotiana attenuata TaxID=49451 RepID=A0A314KUY0_NICAT|nr:hipl1 protein [Nicotiana attenuata]